MGLESCAVRCLKSYRYTWVVVDVFGSNPLWSWKANFAPQKEKNMHHSFELPDHPAEKPLESKTTTNKLKKCEQKHFVQLLCLKQYVPPTTKKTWHMFSAYENFQPKHHCQNGWFPVLEPIFTYRVNPKNHQTILLLKQRMRCPGSSKKKNGHFSHFLGVNLQVSKSPSEPRKQRPGRFVANAVTCVLFVYVVSLLVLQNHAEDLSRQWCGCILRF